MASEQADTDFPSRADADIDVIQFYGICADQLADMIFNLCVQDFIALIPATKDYLQDYFEDEISSPNDIQFGIRKFVQQFYSSLDVPIEILANYIRRVVMDIPPQVIIGDMSVHQRYEEMFGLQKENFKSFESKMQELSILTKKAREEQKFLRHKLQVAEEVEKKLFDFLRNIKTVENKPDLLQVSSLMDSLHDIEMKKT